MDGLLPVMLFILLPAVGTAAAAILAWRAFRDARLEAGTPEAPAGQPDRALPQLMILMMITATSTIFGFVCYFFVGLDRYHPADDAVLAMGACIGLAGLFTALGQGIIARPAARDLVRAPANFGRHLVVMTQCEPHVILAFMVVVLSTMANPPPAGLARANYIMAVSSIGAVVSGILAANVDPLQLPKRLIRVNIGTSLALVGFLAALWLLRMG